MMQYEDQCCGCSADGFPCQGLSCPSHHVLVYYCDQCGDEIGTFDDLYEVDGEEICEECLKNRFRMEDKR